MLTSQPPQNRTPRLATAFNLMGSRLAKSISSPIALFAAVLIIVCSPSGVTQAQTDDAFGSPDPVKLFERGQNAHARNDLIKALEFYEEALKVRPEFAEAEFQRANALVGLKRFQEAESAFRHTLELKKDWSLPYASYGSLLVRLNRDAEAEPLLRNAWRLDDQNYLAVRVLADIRLRAGDTKEALELARRATGDKDAPPSTWILRALAERAAGDKVAALTSLGHLLQLEPNNYLALIERAEIYIANGDNERAITDLKTAEASTGAETARLSRLAADYELAGKTQDAERVAKAAGLSRPPQHSQGSALKVIGTPEEIEAANSEDAETARKALEVLLVKNPNNAQLLSRLGASYRTVDPNRSLDYYRRAADIEPTNADYATGYGSALVQARRFAEAAAILRRVIAKAPDNFAAHANLATALYESKQFVPALEEYEWLLKTKPDLTIAYYFIATAHDYLGEYPDALRAYETFLSHANATTNQLEIDKIKLRLPSLRRQIQLGQGAKRKTERATHP